MHRLSTAFILGYHGCDRAVGERLLNGEPFEPSDNDYDWLGPGVYFWESNPMRGLEFAKEVSRRREVSTFEPFVIGAIIDLGLCLDLTTSSGLEWMRIAYKVLVDAAQNVRVDLPTNGEDQRRRNLDCSVVRRLHAVLGDQQLPPIDTIKGIFTEGPPAYPGAGFPEKTHIQIAVRNLRCIKGVFRVPAELIRP